jgi:hypothetical protein
VGGLDTMTRVFEDIIPEAETERREFDRAARRTTGRCSLLAQAGTVEAGEP